MAEKTYGCYIYKKDSGQYMDMFRHPPKYLRKVKATSLVEAKKKFRKKFPYPPWVMHSGISIKKE